MTQSKIVLLADNDEIFCQTLSEQLGLHEGYSVIVVASGADALGQVKANKHDLILLGVGLSDLDGREVCKRMREIEIKTPIIMLTDRYNESDTIVELGLGPNDYVTKPFRIGVLVTRMGLHLRRHEQKEEATLAIGPYCFRPATKTLFNNVTERTIRLTDKETAIIKFLYRAGSKVIGREVLFTEVWGYNAGVTTHTLETHIYRLRRKIEERPAEATILVTESGGYRLVP